MRSYRALIIGAAVLTVLVVVVAVIVRRCCRRQAARRRSHGRHDPDTVDINVRSARLSGQELRALPVPAAHGVVVASDTEVDIDDVANAPVASVIYDGGAVPVTPPTVGYVVDDGAHADGAVHGAGSGTNGAVDRNGFSIMRTV